jgi:hypothetical protein
VVDAEFEVRKTRSDYVEEWYYKTAEMAEYKKIPGDIIHWGEAAPYGLPTLFVYDGEEFCFWPPDGWMLFWKGDRRVTAEMLYEEALKAKVPVSLATVYNTLHQFIEAGLLRQVAVDGSIPTLGSTIISSSRPRTTSSIFRIPKSSSAGGQPHRKATRLSASTWWCVCVEKRANDVRNGDFLLNTTAKGWLLIAASYPKNPSALVSRSRTSRAGPTTN